MDYATVRLRLSMSEQGRQTPINPRGRAAQRWYMPHFRVGPSGEYLGVAFVDGPAALAPGEEGDCEVVLMYEGVDYTPLVEGAEFDVLEGRKVVARGSVLRRWRTDAPWAGLTSA